MKLRKKPVLIISISILFLIFIIFIGLYLNWNNNYRNKIFRGASIGKINLEKLSVSEAEKIINAESEKIKDNGLKIKNGNKQINIATDVFSFDADLSLPTLSFDYLATAQSAYGKQEDRGFFSYLLNIFKRNKSLKIKMVYYLDETKLKDLLNNNLSDLDIEPENAYFSYDKANQIKIIPAKLGKEINYDQAIIDIKNNLDNLDDSIISIKTQTKYPEINENELNGLSGQVQKLIGNENMVLLYTDPNGTSSSSEEFNWTIKPDKLITWLSIKKSNGETSLSLDEEKIKQYLTLNIIQKVNSEAVLPRFQISNNKIDNWQSGTAGREMDLDENAKQINQKFLQNERTIYLTTKVTGAVDSSLTNNLNIKEIIGTGVSDFTGSPANRIKNIKVGAAAVHGILIKPGDEFSLVQTLGDVSKESGYFPELVIKGNKTIPEYGGGLCQVGTTIFRSALASGLPITYRQNHSYRVSYYEPAGTDAAVYIPNPDVRFVNDTNNYILIQARIVKSKIYFDFWGTKDGRIVSSTVPVIYNITKPEPTKLIETASIAAGTKKCTEHAHNGADAYFDYKVIYPDNATTTPIKERRFKSHYVPWQEVCLIGTGTASTSNSGTNATSSIISSTSTKAISAISTPSTTATTTKN